jgi:hypothetical protein
MFLKLLYTARNVKIVSVCNILTKKKKIDITSEIHFVVFCHLFSSADVSRTGVQQ